MSPYQDEKYNAELIRAFNAYQRHQTYTEAGKELGVDEKTVARRVAAYHLKNLSQRVEGQFPLEKPKLTSETLSAHDIIARRKHQFSNTDKAKRERLLIPIKVKLDGPIGLSTFGDPHLDDDGTDIALVEEHVRIINRTEGLFASNIGDALNNWTGRLARLYGEQSTSAAEAVTLGRWFVQSVPWLIFLGGNHGAWSGANDPFQWMLENCGAITDNFAVRLNLEFPNGKGVRVNARHDFAGHSMWNTVHGPLKAATMGWRDHLLICGHLHTSGYAVLKDPSTGLISHAQRVSSYKTWDRYAHEKGLPNQNIFCNTVTIINPRYADDDPRLIHVCFDPEEGADYLTWLRNRKS